MLARIVGEQTSIELEHRASEFTCVSWVEASQLILLFLRVLRSSFVPFVVEGLDLGCGQAFVVGFPVPCPLLPVPSLRPCYIGDWPSIYG